MAEPSPSWIAVRCVIGTPWSEQMRAYEERITLWKATGSGEAIAKAREEATAYAAQWDPPAEVLDLMQTFPLFDDLVVDGAEVFSLVRDSSLDSNAYLNAFFDTGSERIAALDD